MDRRVAVLIVAAARVEGQRILARTQQRAERSVAAGAERNLAARIEAQHDFVGAHSFGADADRQIAAARDAHFEASGDRLHLRALIGDLDHQARALRPRHVAAEQPCAENRRVLAIGDAGDAHQTGQADAGEQALRRFASVEHAGDVGASGARLGIAQHASDEFRRRLCGRPRLQLHGADEQFVQVGMLALDEQRQTGAVGSTAQMAHEFARHDHDRQREEHRQVEPAHAARHVQHPIGEEREREPRAHAHEQHAPGVHPNVCGEAPRQTHEQSLERGRRAEIRVRCGHVVQVQAGLPASAGRSVGSGRGFRGSTRPSPFRRPGRGRHRWARNRRCPACAAVLRARS